MSGEDYCCAGARWLAGRHTVDCWQLHGENYHAEQRRLIEIRDVMAQRRVARGTCACVGGLGCDREHA